MEYLLVFALGLLFSFIGSIPPGTINLSVLQLGLEQKIRIAMKFTVAAAIIEYPYAWIAVQFEAWITSAPVVLDNFQLITAIVMTVLGILNLWTVSKPTEFYQKFQESGFRRGIVIALLNPLAIPFWIGVTAYLKAQGWLQLSSTGLLHSYIFGISIGTLLLLSLYTFLANKLASMLRHSLWLKRVPGITLLVLGVYAFYIYFT
ncbi:MAG: LysE family transporter [Flammeovirgaceae bacterium]|nr:LysE family transporter [Flammeovirgaceae bacterium]